MAKSIYSDQQAALIAALVAARKQAKLTQQQVADLLGKPQSFVAKYENGERRLDVVEFLHVAEALGADPVEVLLQVK